ncbi:MAG: hypothetical protein M1818_002160 [Claussenomyces sp. TS43310]|nr:MAG: hypothetical protein M1818_002160 [Claussenomyces sp. TS43310]
MPNVPSENFHERSAKSVSHVIDWDETSDELNPMTWKASKKWRNSLIISLMTFSTFVYARTDGSDFEYLLTYSLNSPLASSMFAPAVPQAMADLRSTNSNLEIWVVSVFVLGFAIGPLVVAPLSEVHGRRTVYLISNFLFLIFTIACGLSTSMGMLTAFRFLAGCAGSTPLTLGGASIGDMFSKEARGGIMAIWGMGPLLGPVLGPIIGGFLSQAKGWKWVFWLQTMISGISLVLGLAFLRETYAVVILERKTRRKVRETGDPRFTSALQKNLTFAENFRGAFVRPMKMLLFSPIVMMLSVYVAIVFGFLYLFITTFSTVYREQYNFGTGSIGLTYLGIGVGCFVGLVALGKTSDAIYRRLTANNGGVAEPEFRLPPLMVTAPLVVISFFWYGWSAKEKTHMSVNMYLVETYGRYSASALAATKILQSIGGALLPLAGPPLYNRLGLGWGNSVLAFVALALVPIPWLFFKYGAVIRKWSTVKL